MRSSSWFMWIASRKTLKSAIRWLGCSRWTSTEDVQTWGDEKRLLCKLRMFCCVKRRQAGPYVRRRTIHMSNVPKIIWRCEYGCAVFVSKQGRSLRTIHRKLVALSSCAQWVCCWKRNLKLSLRRFLTWSVHWKVFNSIHVETSQNLTLWRMSPNRTHILSYERFCQRFNGSQSSLRKNTKSTKNGYMQFKLGSTMSMSPFIPFASFKTPLEMWSVRHMDSNVVPDWFPSAIWRSVTSWRPASGSLIYKIFSISHQVHYFQPMLLEASKTQELLILWIIKGL